MCGFSGYWNFKNNVFETSTNEVIRQMLLLQKHRGPDDSGIVGINTNTKYFRETSFEKTVTFNEHVDLFLGFNRLSILDLSKNGHQPMFSPDKKVVLLYNGEVYNAFDYKDELIAKGHSFVSKTDTEVILHLYLEFGIKGMLNRLNGMFAIAIYDFEKNKVYLTRDRFGIKPLYLLKKENFIAFSSEIKSFKALPDYKLELDKSKLDEFLLFRYVVKDTLFKDIINCLPGTYIEIGNNGEFRVHEYYNINNEGKISTNNDEVLKLLSETLQKSVSSQMISDVKLGCQLSGGIDSSLITHYASKVCTDNQLETISIVFEDPEFSEKKWIDIVSSKLNLISHQYVMDGNYFFNELSKVIWHFEHPISHPNAIGIYLLSKEAKKHVTVLLSGEGADECFGGYYKFITPLISRTTELKRLTKKIIKKQLSLSEIDLDTLIYTWGKDNNFILTSAFGSKNQAKEIYEDFKLSNALKTRKKIIKSLSGDAFQRKRKYEMLTYLPELLLRQDKMSMAHSIENRVPFLDNEVVSLAFSIVESDFIVETNYNNISSTETKYALKEICRNLFSEEFAYRKKVGFGIPEKEFMSSEACQKSWVEIIKPGIEKRGLFNADSLNKTMKNLINAAPDALTTLFLMFSFEIWAQQYLD